MGSRAWLSAAASSSNALRNMRPTIKQRLPDNTAVGHFLLGWGSVQGGDERWRGSGAPLVERTPIENPHLDRPDVRQRRAEMEGNLKKLLSEQSRPLSVPALL